MKQNKVLPVVFCVLLMLGGCSTEIKVNEHGWTFCSCNDVHSDLKREIFLEKDEAKRAELEIEMEITVEECGDFLLKEGASPKEFQEHNRKKVDKKC